MLKALALTGVIIIAAGIGFAGGLAVEKNIEEQKTIDTLVVRQVIEPYTGVGSGVLKHGTIIRGDYKGPESIVGHFNEGTEAEYPGTWVIRKWVNEK